MHHSLHRWVRRVVLPVLLGALCLTGCNAVPEQGSPGIWVIVDADARMRKDLDRLQIQTDHDSVTVWLRNAPPGKQATSWPIELDLPWRRTRMRDVLHIRGYRSQERLVERVAALQFVEGKRFELDVMLTEACAARMDCDGEQGLTCVDCLGTCTSSVVNPGDLKELALSADPLDSYAAPLCFVIDAGDELDAQTMSHDADTDAQVHPALHHDGGPQGLDAGVLHAKLASGDAGVPVDGGLDASLHADAGHGDGGNHTHTDSGAAPTLRDSCVLLMHMDEASWSGVSGEVHDDSGRANDGTAQGAATTTSAGHFGRAGTFDGSGGVKVADAASLRASTALTISAWFYSTDTSTTRWPGIVSKRVGYGDSTAYSVFLGPDDLMYVDVDGEADRFASHATLTRNQWHHVAVVYDGTLQEGERVRLYLDGTLDTVARESSASITAFTSPLSVGDLPGGGDTFVGNLDEVVVWMRALSAVEVSALYGAPVPN